jgi:hypothetical protein
MYSNIRNLISLTDKQKLKIFENDGLRIKFIKKMGTD